MVESEDVVETQKKWNEIHSLLMEAAVIGLKCWKPRKAECHDDWESLDVEFSLKLTCSKGEYKHPDIRELKTFLVEHMDAVTKHDVGKESKEYITNIAETAALFAIFVSPTSSIKSPFFTANFLMQLAAWLHDDGVDTMTYFASPAEKYENVVRCNSLMKRALSGEPIEPNMLEDLKFPYKHTILSSLTTFYDISNSAIANYAVMKSPLLKAWDEYAESQLWYAFEGTLENGMILSDEVFLARAKIATGAPFVLQIALLAKGIFSEEDFDDSIILRELIDTFYFIALMCNGLWSLHKEYFEICDGDGNYLIRKWRKSGKALKVIVEETVATINTKIEELLILEQLLFAMYSNKYSDVVLIIKEIIDGNFFFQLMSPRYAKSDIQWVLIKAL